MNWIEIQDHDGVQHLINLDYVVKVTEDISYRITDNDVAHRDKSTVRIYLRQGDFVRANWTLAEFAEIIMDHRIGKQHE